MEIMSEGTREQVPATSTGGLQVRIQRGNRGSGPPPMNIPGSAHGLHNVKYWKSTHILVLLITVVLTV